jgi:translation initiation factor IF-1
MAKEELMTLDGLVDEILPDGRFRVLLENDHKIIAYTAGKMRRFRIRSVVGDRVQVEMTPYDIDKGRIVYRERTPLARARPPSRRPPLGVRNAPSPGAEAPAARGSRGAASLDKSARNALTNFDGRPARPLPPDQGRIMSTTSDFYLRPRGRKYLGRQKRLRSTMCVTAATRPPLPGCRWPTASPVARRCATRLRPKRRPSP